MVLIKPSYEILTDIDRKQFYTFCENAARTCYKSEDKITEGSAEKLIRNLIKNGHEAMIEHCPNISVRFIHNRAFTHEIVRMRLMSFAQESQRYVKYENKNMEFILPHWLDKDSTILVNEEDKIKYDIFVKSCEQAEKNYLTLRRLGTLAQDARDVLPNSCKTEIVCTANVREWRHVLKLRTEDCAHPEMLRVMRPLLLDLISLLPALFEDIPHDWENE